MSSSVFDSQAHRSNCAGISHSFIICIIIFNIVGCHDSNEPTKSPEEQAIWEINAVRGRYLRDLKRPGKPIVSVNLYGDATDQTLASLKALPDLERLYLHDTGVTNGGMIHVGRMSKLRELDLSDTSVTEPGLSQLKGLEDLRELNLGHTRTTDVGLFHLKDMIRLKTLYIDLTQVTDAGLLHLKGLSALRTLDLGGDRITDKGLSYLKDMTGLQALGLAGTGVSGAGLEHLRGLTKLKTLDVTGTKVSDRDADEVRRFIPGLRR